MSSSALDRLRAIIGDEGIAAFDADAKTNLSDASVLEIPNENGHGSRMGSSGPVPHMAISKDVHGGQAFSGMTLEDALNWKTCAKDSNKHIQGEFGDFGEYCPILAVSKFPYKFMDPKSPASDRVSKRFFADNRFWRNVWNLYYVQVPPYLSAKSLILVPRAEVETLLAIISNQLGLHLKFPSRSAGFVISFKANGSPRPRYLGMSTCRDEYGRLEEETPTAQLDFQIKSNGSILANCSQRTFEGIRLSLQFARVKQLTRSEWAAKIERAIDATRNKNRASKEKRKQQRIATKMDWSRQLRRAQRYLGLRACAGPAAAFPVAEQRVGEDLQCDRPPSSGGDGTIDVTRPMLLPFESNAVFLCIDVEVYERGHTQVTEVGLAILDTVELVNVPPEEDGHAWMELVKGRHFWIKENAHLVNTDYVTGCPERFEASFGVTESVSTKKVTEILMQCFRNPVCAKTIGRRAEVGSSSDGFVSTGTEADSKMDNGSTDGDEPAAPRKIVVVGHDINSDINYLKFIDFDLLAAPNVLEILDTSELYRTMKHEDNAPSVSTMLYHFGISGWNLHNAGNDAAYTLQALLGIAVRSATGGRTQVTDPADIISKAKQDAEELARGNLEEWDFASDGEDADGGAAKDPSRRLTPKKEKKARAAAVEST